MNLFNTSMERKSTASRRRAKSPPQMTSIGIGAEVRIPGRGAPEWRFYTGAIDDVLVFNAGKTAAEINEIMAGEYLAVSAQGKLALTWSQLKLKQQQGLRR